MPHVEKDRRLGVMGNVESYPVKECIRCGRVRPKNISMLDGDAAQRLCDGYNKSLKASKCGD